MKRSKLLLRITNRCRVPGITVQIEGVGKCNAGRGMMQGGDEKVGNWISQSWSNSVRQAQCNKSNAHPHQCRARPREETRVPPSTLGATQQSSWRQQPTAAGPLPPAAARAAAAAACAAPTSHLVVGAAAPLQPILSEKGPQPPPQALQAPQLNLGGLL